MGPCLCSLTERIPLRLLFGIGLGVAAIAQPALGEPDTLPATAPATQPDASQVAQVQELLEALDSPAFADREAAERKLLAVVVAEPALQGQVARAAESHSSAEVRARARTVVRAMADLRRFGTSHVTLQLEQVTAREASDALLAIIEQTMREALGDELPMEQLPRYWPEDDPYQGDVAAATRLVDVDLVDVPLWEAVAAVGEVTGLWPVEHQSGIAFSRHGQPFQNYPRAQPPEAQAGLPITAGGDVAVVIELTGAHRSANGNMTFVRDANGEIRGGQNGGGSSLAVQMRVLVEPKIQLADGQVQLIVEEATDEAGRDLGEPASDWRGSSSSGGTWAVQVGFPLDPNLSRDSQRLAHLKGFVELEVASETAAVKFDVTDVAESLQERVGEREETAGEVVPDQEAVSLPVNLKSRLGQWEVEIVEVVHPALPPHIRNQRRRGFNPNAIVTEDTLRQIQFELQLHGTEAERLAQDWPQLQRLMRGLALVDAEGRAWQGNQQNQEYDRQTQTLKVSMVFSNWNAQAAMPASLLWRVPVQTRPLRVPFEFHDVPLPQLQ